MCKCSFKRRLVLIQPSVCNVKQKRRFLTVLDVLYRKHLQRSVPDFEEAVPGPCSYCHPIISYTQTAYSVVMAGQHTCKSPTSIHQMTYVHQFSDEPFETTGSNWSCMNNKQLISLVILLKQTVILRCL